MPHHTYASASILCILCLLWTPHALGQEPPARLRPEVIRTIPHDPSAWTQGLVWYNDHLYESTGLYRRSSIRQLSTQTATPNRTTPLPPTLFGEGIARNGSKLVQLTWKAGIALHWDLNTMKQSGRFRYGGDGWGLCFDGTHFIMSNGTNMLAARNSTTFALERSIRVSGPRVHLNALACAGGKVYANVWNSDNIVVIDPTTGTIDAWIDASGLLTPHEARRADILNGIAYNPKHKTFFITGKRWPKIFEVRFNPVHQKR